MGYYFRRGWALDDESVIGEWDVGIGDDALLDGISAVNDIFQSLSGPETNIIPLEWASVKAIQSAMESNLGIEISATDVLESLLEYNESQRDKEL